MESPLHEAHNKPDLENGNARRRGGCPTTPILLFFLLIGFGLVIYGAYMFSKEINSWGSPSPTGKETILGGYSIVPDYNITKESENLLNLTDPLKFLPEVGKVSFLNDFNKLYYENEEEIQIMDFDAESTSLLVSKEEIQQLLNDSAIKECSFDCRFVSLTTPVENPSTNPELERCYVSILDVTSNMLHNVGRMGQKERIRYQKWSPAGDDFLFAMEGQLYYVEKAGEEPILISYPTDEEKVHGVFDWMTDEEIFSTREASWWSTRGDKIAFASRELVSEPSITITAFREEEQYQIETPLFYGKVGYKNLSVYSISVWDKASGVLKKMNVQLNDKAFHYLFGVSWILHGEKEFLVAVWANRWQNHTFITYCDFETAECSQVFEEIYPPRTWALPSEYKKLKSARDSLFLILPHKMKDGNMYQHVARVNVKTGTKQFLSMGNFDVKEIVHHDESKGLLYFHTTAPRPTAHHLYVTEATKTSNDSFRCVSCSVAKCSVAKATFSDDGERVVLRCLGPDLPRKYLAKLGGKGEMENVREVLHERKLGKLIGNTALPRFETREITLDNGIVATTRLYTPRATNLSSLPLLVYVYNGPGYQLLGESFSVGKLDPWVMNLNIAVLKIDARGSGGRGWNYRSPIYGALGTVEMEDQIKATQAVLKLYPFLDSSRVALYGWSYGGFATIRVVQTAPTGMFKCAISGAPVTNFQYYDAAYTERYMGSAPKEDYINLNKGDMGKFNSTRLLLIHGLADDNVHFQNSAIFSEELQKKQVDFDFMVYSNARHSPRGKQADHLVMMMTSFLKRCLIH